MRERPLRVLSVDDHQFLVEGLKARFALEPDIEFAGWLRSAEELAPRLRRDPVDVVLLDIEMPGGDPFEAVADAARLFPDTRVIMLSAYVRDQHIDAAVRAGAWGYVSKSDSPESVIAAIRQAARGEFAFGPKVVQRCQSRAPRGADGQSAASRLTRLTPRELQVLRMIGRGLSRTEIAAAIHRSAKTVDNHRAAIMEKLDIRDRVELARFAIREGLTEA